MSPLEPYQSDAFREMRKRVHSLSTPPTASPPRTHKQPSLPPSGTTPSALVTPPAQMQCLKSPSPSPPPSEASPSSYSPSSSQTPLTQASDSSASSFDDMHMHRFRRSSRRATHKARAWSGTPRRSTGSRGNFTLKRVLSEDDIFLPRLAKRNRSHASPVASKRTLFAGRSASASLPVTSPSPLPSVASSWRRAVKRQRKRRSTHADTAHAFHKARASSRTRTSGPGNQDRAPSASESVPRLDVLPELRLLSATRTAPIGWTRMASISNPLAHTLEMYDERNAKQAPERQRFWPIVDHQLDYTGARMLSLSSARNGPLQLGTRFTKPATSLPIDEPVSPKSGVAPLMPSHTLPMQPGMASSDEDRSPLTPGAVVEPTHTSATVSRYARDAVRNEPYRKPSVQLSPPATLAAMIDFTRAQHDRRQRQSAAHVDTVVEPERNAYGQLLRSPFSPPVACALAPHAPPRIAPRAAPTKDRDYFGHWESYLCGYGKESTF